MACLLGDGLVECFQREFVVLSWDMQFGRLLRTAKVMFMFGTRILTPGLLSRAHINALKYIKILA